MKFRALAVGTLVTALAGPAAAEETTLMFATLDGPQAHLNVHIHHPWAERINQAGKGTVRLDVRDGPTVANQGTIYSRVQNDVVQVGWMVHSSVPGKFPRTSVTSLPFVSDRSEHASTAIWRLFKTGLLDEEYDEAVPFKFCVFAPNALHFRSAPASVEDFRGLKMIATGKVPGEVVTALGATPVAILVSDMYPALQRATADGVSMTWTAFQPFKLGEVTKFHIDSKLGAGTGMVFMARKKHAALPDAVKKLLEAAPGEKESRDFGAFWDRVAGEIATEVKGQPGHTVVEPSADQVARWKQRLAPVQEEWVKATPNGAAVLARYRQILSEIAR
jgi:TRAP-type C4-dicarboxylate transport system substrate-binding protein